MNTTIDLKTAKTIEAMNQKVNHMDTAVTDFFNKMSDVLERQLGDDEVYAARAGQEITIKFEEEDNGTEREHLVGAENCTGTVSAAGRDR